MLDLDVLLGALSDAGVEFVLIGGMAAVAHGSAHVTADVDICYRRAEPNLQRLAEALRPFGPYLRDAPPGLPFKLDAATIKAGLTFTLTTTAGDLDLMGEVAGLGDYEAVKAAAEAVELHGRCVWVLTIEGLIRAKEAAGRPKDLRLLPELRAIQALRQQTRDEPQ